uniref:Cinnamoyl-CoA reductase n=1 Tax=Daucus carota subsp. carota TaxID=79196 RepID=A0A172WBP6_DAUCA|nr:cinnamoyl-CoA reductase [Daucus carota subsp. carota]
MGIVRTDEHRRSEIESFRRLLLSCAGACKSKEEEEIRNSPVMNADNDGVVHDKVVCVTSGVSFLGIAIVNQLLLRGYNVRIIVDNQDDVDNLREMERSGEMRGTNNRIGIVMAKLYEAESLSDVFSGCCGVFHTSAFIDPAGLSGYSKFMADLEVKAAENVVEACAVTPSIRHCVLTSSLLACTWKDYSVTNVSPVINHHCWSDESLCIEKKLWYALGKLRAEKAAWRVAEERGLKLTTICPGLIRGPEFFNRNTTSTIAYLKGAQEMYEKGLLASVDVNRLAEAHVCVFEEMSRTASGRYICFDQVIKNEEEVETLAQETGIRVNLISETENASADATIQFQLSNLKLSRLMSRVRNCKITF